MKFETDQERLVRKITEWAETLTEEDLQRYIKEKEKEDEFIRLHKSDA